MKNLKTSSRKITDSNFGMVQKIFMFCLVTMFLTLPLVQFAQESSVVRDSIYLENKGTNWKEFTFDPDQWQYVIVKLNGTYQKDFTGKPSQHFDIAVNGKNIYNGDLHGGATATHSIDGDKNAKLVVTAKLKSANGASTYSAGEVKVLAFREKPGLFYVTEVIYDTKKAKIVDSSEPLKGIETIEENNTDEESSGTFKAVYTETSSLTWEKSFEHSESVGISIGYKTGGTGPGIEAMASLAANFKTAFKTGSTEQKSETIERSITYKVPPHTTKRIFAVQNKLTYTMPYKLKGYTLDDNGNKIKPFEKEGTCIFVGVQSTRILQEPMKKEGQLQTITKPEVIAEWPSVLK